MINIVGLPLTSYAEASADSATQENIVSTEQAVMKLATETLKVPLQPTDISIARRVSSRVSTNTVPRVMVRFTNQKARNMVFAARSSLKVHARNTGVNIYINEDLTGPTADQFRRAREMVKGKRLHKCWTYGGVVFVKKINEQSSQPVKLSLSTDLTSL